MSKRWRIREVVALTDEDDGPYLGRIDPLGSEREDECLRCADDPTHDQRCREWPNVEVSDAEGRGTGQYVYHVPECEMNDSQ